MTKAEEIERLERFAAEFPVESYSRDALLAFVEIARRMIERDWPVPTYQHEIDGANAMAGTIRDNAEVEASKILMEAKRSAKRICEDARTKCRDDWAEVAQTVMDATNKKLAKLAKLAGLPDPPSGKDWSDADV